MQGYLRNARDPAFDESGFEVLSSSESGVEGGRQRGECDGETERKVSNTRVDISCELKVGF